MKKLIAIFLILSLTGCTTLGVPESAKPKNAIKTVATTGATYAIAGPVPAIVNLVTSVLVDETLPPADTSCKVEKGNTQQMWSCLFEEMKELIIGGVIVFLIFTTVVAPWASQRRQRRKRKYEQYKAEAKAARVVNAQAVQK
jgi:ABC-type dipeptide/oligopeptide/nickel transport system permease component